MADKGSNKGLVQISDAVLISIVKTVTIETEGVHSISSSFASEIMEKFGKKKKGISIEKQNGKLIINIGICIKQNYQIIEVTQKIQQKVKEAVEEMTGLKIEKINVNVSLVELTKTK